MGLSRAEIVTLAAGGLWAIGLPALMLMPERVNAPPLAPPPLLASVAPPSAMIIDRRLFASELIDETGVPPPADAPQLIGIAGRIGRDAVALVRDGDGRNRTLGVGDSADGWRLESLAIDAAFFARGRERLRVPLPTG